MFFSLFRFLEQQNIADLAIIPAREARERLYKLFRWNSHRCTHNHQWWYDMIDQSMIVYKMIWYDRIGHDMIDQSMIWYGIIWFQFCFCFLFIFWRIRIILSPPFIFIHNFSFFTLFLFSLLQASLQHSDLITQLNLHFFLMI